jgi:hypothetical protein
MVCSGSELEARVGGCATIAGFGKHQPPPGVKGLNCLFYIIWRSPDVLGPPILCNNFSRSLKLKFALGFDSPKRIKDIPASTTVLFAFLQPCDFPKNQETNKRKQNEKSQSKMAPQNHPTWSAPGESRSPWERPHLATEAPPPTYQNAGGYRGISSDQAQPRYTQQGPVQQPQVVYVDRRQHRESDVAAGCCAGCAAGLCCCGCTVM